MKDHPTDRTTLGATTTLRRKRFLDLLRKEGLEVSGTGTKQTGLRPAAGRVTCRVREFLRIDRIERPAN